MRRHLYCFMQPAVYQIAGLAGYRGFFQEGIHKGDGIWKSVFVQEKWLCNKTVDTMVTSYYTLS